MLLQVFERIILNTFCIYMKAITLHVQLRNPPFVSANKRQQQSKQVTLCNKASDLHSGRFGFEYHSRLKLSSIITLLIYSEAHQVFNTSRSDTTHGIDILCNPIRTNKRNSWFPAILSTDKNDETVRFFISTPWSDIAVSGILAPLILNLGTGMRWVVKFRTQTFYVRERTPFLKQWDAQRAPQKMWIVIEHVHIFDPAEIQTPIFQSLAYSLYRLGYLSSSDLLKTSSHV